ncbi:MAG: sigma-70 family RNA polymerase sigma factor [Acidobacteriota bacterium]
MSSESADSTLSGLAVSTRASGPTPLEIEVADLFDQFRAPLLRYLSSFGLAVQDSEEVVQEVFLALFQHLRRNKPRTNLPSWIFRVGHNLALKRCQANRRVSVGAAETLPERDPLPNPEQQAASVQRSRRLLAVVRALPEHDRRCLYLRAEGLRYREIVDVLGMSLGAVAQSLEKSLGRLSAVKE